MQLALAGNIREWQLAMAMACCVQLTLAGHSMEWQPANGNGMLHAASAGREWQMANGSREG